MQDRRPIDTAPKDGTEILAYGRYAWGGDWHLPDFTKGKTGWAVISYVERPVHTPLPNGGFPGGEPDAMGVWELVGDTPERSWMDPEFWVPLLEK